jgi:uncharacterized protein (DUF362 family)
MSIFGKILFENQYDGVGDPNHSWKRGGNMNRRKFLKLVAGASATAVCPFVSKVQADRGLMDKRIFNPGQKRRVFLAAVSKGASDQAVRDATRRSAEAATDFSWLSRGDAVFIKPVINSGNPYPATTNPHAVAAMTELLLEKGAGKVIVGDMSGVERVRLSPAGLSGSSRKLMEDCGMSKVIQSSGAELHFFEEAGWDAFYEENPVAGSHWKRGLMMPNILKNIQHIVLMPRCGRHILAGSSLGLKAAVGYWRHDTRLEYHHDAKTFHEKTAEANTIETLQKKQRLVVTAADKILTTFGPDKGFIFQPETGLVIASESVVAHDMTSLAWLLLNRKLIPESEKNGFLDTGSVAPRFANRMVVSWLGGWGKALFAESFTKQELSAVWDDRVLCHAYEVFSGTPLVELTPTDKELPPRLKKHLEEMMAIPD